MDPPSSPRLGRRARYESISHISHLPDPNYRPQRHPPFATFAPHPAGPIHSGIPGNQYFEHRLGHGAGDISYLPSPRRSNPSGFDPRDLPFPRVSDSAIHRGLSDAKYSRPEVLERGRGGSGAFDGPGRFDEEPDRFRPYDNLFELGHSDGALDSRRRQEPEQDRYLGVDSEWKRQRPVRFWDERESRYRDPFLEHLPPIADPLAPAAPPFPSPRGLRGAGLVKNSAGDASRVSVHRHTPSSPCFFGGSSSDAIVVKRTGTMAGNSQIIGNGSGLQRVQFFDKKRNNDSDGPSDRGLEGRQYAGHKSIKRSDPSDVANEGGFRSIHHMVRKTSSIPSMDTEHEFEKACYTGYNGKRKMTSNKGAEYSANLQKRTMLKPSAFSRIQSGLSVWERLEEKSSILSPPRSSPSSRISKDAETKANIFDRSFESNTLVTKVLDPFSAETSSIKDTVFVEKPNRVTKKNMTQTTKMVIIPAVSSFHGSSRKSNRVTKKKNKKYIVQPREKVVIPIVSSSPGSIAKKGVVRDFKLSSPGSVSVPEAKITKVSSCMPGSKSMSSDWTKTVKKPAEDKKSGAEEADKMFSQVDSCIIVTPRMEDSTEIPKHGGPFNFSEEESNSIHNVDSITEPVGVSHSQICQKIQTKIASPSNNVIADIISTDVTEAQDIVIEILDDSEKDSSEQGKKSDTIYQNPSDFDVNVCSQPSEHIIVGHAAHDSFVNIATNSIKQIKSVNSPQKLGQDMPPADNAVSPQVLCSDTSLKLEGEVRQREEMSIATKELEVPGNSGTPQSCIHGPQVPSFSHISNSVPEQKLHSKETVEENNMLPQSICNMTFLDSVGTLTIDSRGKNIGQALLLGPMETDTTVTHFENVSHSNQEQSHIGNGNPEHISKGELFLSSIVSQASEPGYESGKTIQNHQLIPEKAQLLPSHELKEKLPPNPKLTDEKLSCKKTSPLADVKKFRSNKLNFSASLKEAARASQTGRHRTWVRINTPSLYSDENLKQGGILSKQVPKRLDKTQNSSYFRKGNSLIRKLCAEPSPSVPPTLGCSGRKFKSSAREIRSEGPNNVAHSDPLFEGLKTPLPPLSKLSAFSMNSCKDFPQLIPIDRSPEPGTDLENQHDRQSAGLFACNLESSPDTASSKIVGAKRLIYVKRKMNQLVATPGLEIGESSKFLLERSQKSVHHPIELPKKMPFSSYLYHRSKKNQLIRNETSSDSKVTGIPAGNTNSVDSLEKGSTLPYKKRLDNVLQKKKSSTGSLVWTLGGNTLSQKCIATFGCQRVFPYIFPWKRAVNWKNFKTPNNIPISTRSSISLISRNLQSLRKRDTIYKVSTNGFALRKAGVVSISGSSLKWSKSIEKRSKKASEEATLAVAEVERKKRERKRSKSTTDKGKNKVQLTCKSTWGIELKRGERIFRVGSARYKMDASMRTLSRIPDDNSTSSASQKQGNSSQISFIPRRLIIGNNEYVGIGNGNQLIRDPKRLKRILANEKVRWSLHSARLRLAQKSQFCLFFTRFGECNKSGRRCPYIHDPTKVAICTKFLKDQCSDTHCKLTHKVIPERMPDCAYFLKGMCTNINCPYRHVKVNANAALCDGFLRGHCADGDECRKKHSYTCPLFEATGSCPQGSLCKLHHPKNKSKSKKRKRSEIQNSSHGRYFYSIIGKEGSAESVEVPSGQNDLEGDNDIFCSDGRFTEYINLDDDDDDIVALKNDRSYTGELDSGFLDFQSCDIDVLIKPIRINNGDDMTIF
ncbi:uncharacterized protein LOC110026215 [Phalaenopsis equestris]|uniref:uncharacterized protein LOC110026215 n=1 Tax=Phalaenopsis equestris TaxID=78828 RepID=UPI0009E2021F|nr:uncharacterized protein LOC110026215 [Phalaenopsis equestris]